MATEERSKEAEEEVVYKTKVVKFLGRSTPIVLQNDNGPCPLLAICNVMLLRNNLSLSLDASEVSLQKLLSLVAERLIDSNSNVQDKDDEYVNNQQQNIADAIDLLPRLATGIDVNVQFRKINDFEFTRECAIFDLFDIGLFHGWIVDPQDTETAAVIGSKSYNTLVGELVAFQTRKSEGEGKSILEEDCVDFAAATTATLGVPSPSLSRGRSFDDSSVSVPVEQRAGRGDREEEVELMRALNLSRTHLSSPLDESLSPYSDWGNFTSPEESRGNFTSSEESTHFKRRIVADSAVGRVGDESDNRPHSDLFASPECNTSIDHKDFGFYSKDHVTENDNSPPKITAGNNIGQSVLEGSGNFLFSGESTENLQTDMLVEKQSAPFLSPDRDGSAGFSAYEDRMIGLREDQSAAQTCTEGLPNSQIDLKASDNQINFDSSVFSSPAAPCADLHTSDGRVEELDVSEGVTSSLEGSEPIYEGEECILDYGHPIYEDQEPVYEGEMILAEQADKREEDSCLVRSKEKVAEQKWRLIQNFLENNASQLTIYGLFCLQEGLNERELCVFFRNNHFSTMFKYNGELYLLATDQGYINQPDLVWEKLNEVNGDTMFVTGNFEEFKPENQTNGSWDEQNAMTTTADFIATLEGSAPASSILNSDLQLAIALQQQEFGQQHHSQKPQSSQQPSVSGRSRLVTGPQVPRNPNPPQKQEAKAKDKCVVM